MVWKQPAWTLAITLTACAAPLARAQQSYYEPREFAAPTAVEAKPISPSGSSRTSPAVFPFRQLSAAEDMGTKGHELLKLAPRKSDKNRSLVPTAASANAGPIGTVVGSLAIVLGLFMALVWVSRRFAPAGSAALPKEVVELLGRSPLTARQSMQLVRVGNRLLLVAVAAGGVETLTEITDPLEVERLSALCRRGRTDSATASFNQVLGQLASETREPPPAAARPRVRGAT